MSESGISTARPAVKRKIPLYKQVEGRLEEIIKTRGLSNGDEMPSINSLAKKLDVNYRTVRSAFKSLEDKGIVAYEANCGAVVTAKRVHTKVSLCYIRQRKDAFSTAMSTRIGDFCREKKVDYVVIDPFGSKKRFLDSIKHPDNGANGLLFEPVEEPEYADAIRETLEAGNEVVLLDRILPNLDISSVSADHFAGAYQAVNHLLEVHGRDVYYFGRVSGCDSDCLRVEGWSRAMQDHSIFDTDLLKYDAFTIENKYLKEGLSEHEALANAARDFFKSIIDKSEKYSVFAGNNYYARYIYLACEELGLKIGQDVFVVGSGDAPKPETFSVPLSAVWQNSEQVGYEGAKLLYERITGKLEKPAHRILPIELRVRESSTGKK